MNRKTPMQYDQFQERIKREFFTHKVINHNEFCQWFKDAKLTEDVVRNFAVQFSVFSNLFLIAQLKKTINAESLEEMRASKEILASELGTIFKPKKAASQKEDDSRKSAVEAMKSNSEELGDPDLVSTEGSVDGGRFRFEAAHFEWLLKFAKPLKLGFKDIGKRKHGTKETLFFCDELDRLYGNEDFSIGAGASYAVENWAAAGFWKELISGLKNFKQAQCPELSLAFFTWHDKVEDQHAAHTHDELKDIYFYSNFDEEKFIKSGKEILDAVLVFWEGLNDHRKSIQ
jgi:hypothetical protein